MPRRVRELENNGIYHIFNRSNDRRKLFREPEDYQFFLNLLKIKKEKYSSDLFHYCLMTNHYHFLLRIKIAKELKLLMHELQLGYARYFKNKYKLSGHIFQERYRSPRIPEESYYLQCGRYIERNPVKASMVKEAWEYLYSSASHYALGQNDQLITKNLYYEGMGKSEEERRGNYRDFLLLEDPYSTMIDKQLVKV